MIPLLFPGEFRFTESSLTPRERVGYDSSHTAQRGFLVPTSFHLETELLHRWRSGDQAALQALIPLVYRDLRLAAHRCLRAERPDHTLQSTELVHEVYLRLAGNQPLPTENRAHFVAIAARLMRQILVDYARRRSAAKRGPQYKVELDSSFDLPQRDSVVDIVALDDALSRLSRRDVQQERIVEMRFFGGLTVEETAVALEVSPATVKRDWNMAKAWLMREVGRDNLGRNRTVAAN
jgi:RNA polymerase sigma factor (TIGR02999 family)